LTLSETKLLSARLQPKVPYKWRKALENDEVFNEHHFYNLGVATVMVVVKCAPIVSTQCTGSAFIPIDEINWIKF
jgi:hypothetical protein